MSVAPEKLSLEEQIYIWNNADEIACINGTIPLNVVFSKNKNLKLTVLNKTSISHENPYILLQFREIKADFIGVYKEPFKNYLSPWEKAHISWQSKKFLLNTVIKVN